jgi:hypothetical protein
MTTDERAAIRARAEAATPGPWWRVSDRPDGHPLFFDGNGCDLIMSGVDPDTSDCDDRFVIAARTDVPALLDHADAQDRRIAELEALVRSLSERVHKQSELLSKRAEVQVP